MNDNLRFLHTADIHLHASHKYLGERIKVRAQDFYKTLLRMKDFIKNERIPVWFISGDLWEHERVTPPTISFLQKLFSDLSDTHIFISPGNHDPYLPDSYYVQSQWPDNVTIFTDKWGFYPLPQFDACVYGIGFGDPHQRNNPLHHFPGKRDGFKRHLMILHASVEEYITESDSSPYAPISLRELEALQMDYIALGHIHKPRIFYNHNQAVIAAYSGSPESLRSSETGERTAWFGEWQPDGLKLQPFVTQTRMYRRVEIDLSGVSDLDELVIRITDALRSISREEILQVNLVGEITRHIEIDVTLVEPLFSDFFYIKWINATKPDYDLEQLKQENSLLAYFIEKVESKKMLAQDEDTKALLDEAKLLILDAMIRKEVSL